MTRLTLYLIAFALGAAAAVGLVSCGGSDDELLPGDDASQILANLDTVEELVAEGQCDEAVSKAAEIGDQVEELPRSVDRALRERLAEGVLHLEEVAATDCEEPTTITETTEPPEEETDTTETTDTTDTTDTTETTPTTQPTEPTQPTTPTTPPTTPTDDNGDSGGIGPGGTSGFEGGSG